MRSTQQKPVYIALDFDGVLHHHFAGPNIGDHQFLRQGRQHFIDQVEMRYQRTRAVADYWEPEGRLFDREYFLLEVLKKQPNARIVIATSWRESIAVEDLATLLCETVRDRVVGALDWDPNERGSDGVRGCLMEKWLCQKGQAGSIWIALDDQSRHYSKHRCNLVQTNWRGLDMATVDSAVAALIGRTKAPIALV